MHLTPGPAPRPLLSLLTALLICVGVLLTPAGAQAAGDDEGLRMLTAANRGEPIPGLPPACTGVPQKCEVGVQRPNAPTVVLWGDSHAWQLIPAVRAAIGQDRVNLVLFMYGGCPPHHSGLTTAAEVRAASPCGKLNYRALKYVKNQKRLDRDFRVVVAGGWELYRYALARSNPGGWQEETAPSIANAAKLTVRATPRLFRTLGNQRIPTDVVGQMPTVPTNAPPCPEGMEPYMCDLPRDGALPSSAYIRAYVERQRALLAGPARVIDPTPGFCSRTQCAGRLPDGQSVYYRDNTHISLALSTLLRPFFEPTVARLLVR